MLVLRWVVFKLVITVHDAPHLCVCEKYVKCFIVFVAMQVMCYSSN